MKLGGTNVLSNAPAPSAPKVLPNTIPGYWPLRIQSYTCGSANLKSEERQEAAYVSMVKGNCLHFHKNLSCS